MVLLFLCGVFTLSMAPQIVQADGGWYIAPNGQQAGPLTLDQVKESIQAGKVSRETLVWSASWKTGWRAAKDVREINQLFPAGPSAPLSPAIASQPTTQRFMRYLIGGAWIMDPVADYEGTISKTFAFRSDGTYAGVEQRSGTVEGVFDRSFSISGTWEVVAVDDSRFILYLDKSSEQSTRWSLEMVDQNTFRDVEENWVFKRDVSAY